MTTQANLLGARLRSVPVTLLRRLQWQAKLAVSTTGSGEYRSVFRGRGVEFDQVVQYQWGDDPRDIDWNVTARLGVPYRKKFVEERDLEVIFVFEDAVSLQFGTTERSRRQSLLETVSMLALVGSLHRDRVGLLYCSPTGSWLIPPKPGRAGAMRCVTRLLAATPPRLDAAPRCDVPWQALRRTALHGSVIVWAGPFAPSAKPVSWNALRADHRLLGVRADDPWDLGDLPPDAQFTAYDPVAGWLTELDGSSRASQRAHERWRAARDSYLAELFPREDDRILVGTTHEPFDVLVQWFQRQKPDRSFAMASRA